MNTRTDDGITGKWENTKDERTITRWIYVQTDQ